MRSASNASSTVVRWDRISRPSCSACLRADLTTSNAAGSFYEYYTAGFVQDDWRVSRNLTLNLGLRFDHDCPVSREMGTHPERLRRDVAESVERARRRLPTTRIPMPQLPASDFQVLGRTDLRVARRTISIYNTTSHLFSPRFGVAWTPERLHGKTVVRAGFAMFVSPITIASLQRGGDILHESDSDAAGLQPVHRSHRFHQSTS